MFLPHRIIRERGTQNLGQTQNRAILWGHGQRESGDVVEGRKGCWLVGRFRVYKSYGGNVQSDDQSNGCLDVRSAGLLPLGEGLQNRGDLVSCV